MLLHVLLLLSTAPALLATSVQPSDPPALTPDQLRVALCLRNATIPCADDAPCPPAVDFSRACLRTPIPAFAVPYRRVRCCFRCCLARFCETHNLTANHAYWTDMPPFRVPNEKVFGAVPGLTEVLLGPNSYTVISDMATWGKQLPHPKWRQWVKALKSHGRALAKHGDKLFWFPDLNFADPHASRARLVVSNHMYSVKPFFARVYPQLRAPVTLVVEDDDDMPTPEGGRFPRSLLARAPLVRQVFTSNPAPGAPAHVHGLPLGLAKLPHWHAALDGREVNRARPRLLHCGYMAGFGARKKMWAALRKNGFVCNQTPVPREQYPFELLDSRFVAAAHGNGHNNHREWEAMVAGAVPLVDYHAPLAPTFEGLPVVLVKDWHAVTAEFLRAKWEEVTRDAAEGRVSLTKAFWPHWLERLTAMQVPQ